MTYSTIYRPLHLPRVRGSSSRELTSERAFSTARSLPYHAVGVRLVCFSAIRHERDRGPCPRGTMGVRKSVYVLAQRRARRWGRPVGRVGVVTLSRPTSARMPAEDPERPDGSVRLRRVAVDPDSTSGEGALAEGGGRTRQRPGPLC